uniref:Uncharacterized protein n=1 Tax=Timema douglasi TaxID=61478 RepID=A0A7R8VMK8_TIMDO|nr:unnamed protein product [Timema douglasi]
MGSEKGLADIKNPAFQDNLQPTQSSSQAILDAWEGYSNQPYAIPPQNINVERSNGDVPEFRLANCEAAIPEFRIANCEAAIPEFRLANCEDIIPEFRLANCET